MVISFTSGAATLTAPACSEPFTCEDTRNCDPGGAGGKANGEGGELTGGGAGEPSSLGGNAGSGSGGKGSTSNAPTDGGTAGAGVDETIGNVGADCVLDGAYGCAGHAVAHQLVCTDGKWTSNGTCSAGTLCDSRAGASAGTCQQVLSECAGKSARTTVCNGAIIESCGPDLVTATQISTCKDQACVDGKCTGECSPGAKRCSGDAVQTCDAAGQWGAALPCDAFCSAGTCATPPSCASPSVRCGPTSESCCESPVVTGGSFFRSYDGVNDKYLDKSFPATLTSFRLDRFEVTRDRFRKFATAWNAGWRPAPGSGKHTHLNGGNGVTDSSGASAFESGWDASWVGIVDVVQPEIGDGSAESFPANANWYASYAFCIWDGGFLPTEAELNYAAAGGAEQRIYPWSNPPSAMLLDCTYANTPQGNGWCPPWRSVNAVGSESPKGDGKYGQADLGGNASEWTLDWYVVPPSTSCTDCAYLMAPAEGDPTLRTLRDAPLVSRRQWYYAEYVGDDHQGVRCARSAL